MAARTTQAEINAAIIATLGNMNVVLNNMQNNNNNNNNHQHQRDTKTSLIARNKPKTYAGEIDPIRMSDWFRDMEKQFTMFDVDEADKVRIATHYLERDADRWWSAIEHTVVGTPDFGWRRFKELLETRFYPTELKKQRQDEFRSCVQGKMTVQEYHDKFHQLVHFAGEVTVTEGQRLYYYKAGFGARIQSMIGRDAATVTAVYNEALRAEREIVAIRAEDSALASGSYKRPHVLYQPQGQMQKKFKSGNQQTPSRGAMSRESRDCWKCHKAYHPGKNCAGVELACFVCKVPGHRAANCPQKVTTVAAPPPPAKKIFMMTRADAEANPDVITGTFPVQDVRAFIFFDTGASISVVSTTFADKISLVPRVAESTPISLPSGEIISCSTIYSDVPISFAGTIFPSTLLRFPLTEFDVILGMDWLAKYDARFLCRDQKILLKGPNGAKVTHRGVRLQPSVKLV